MAFIPWSMINLTFLCRSMLQDLPRDLAHKICKSLSISERAALGLVCSDWRCISMQDWSDIIISNQTKYELCCPDQAWMKKLADSSQHTVKKIQIHLNAYQSNPLHSIISSKSSQLHSCDKLRSWSMKSDGSQYDTLSQKAALILRI